MRKQVGLKDKNGHWIEDTPENRANPDNMEDTATHLNEDEVEILQYFEIIDDQFADFDDRYYAYSKINQKLIDTLFRLGDRDVNNSVKPESE